MKYLLIIPTYNEMDNIEAIIKAVFKQTGRPFSQQKQDNKSDLFDLNLLIVDDNSPDKTSDKVEDMMKHEERLHILKRPGKKGLGTAYVEGFLYAIQNNYDAIIQMDADFSHDPEVIPQMVDLSKEHDVVIGSRYVCGINVVNWPLSRLILSYMASKYVQIITRMPVKDPTGGFKCIKIDVLKKIHLEKIMSDGYSFQIEINFRAWVNRFDIYEMPIIFTDRRSGQSKMSKKIIYEAVYMVWKLKLMQLLRAL
ncbi:MAG: polyprenol monophosphomannose synthase [Candidatus Cloacimonadales bacterium]|jgi:dolichol-phosphate mannosyltransferase|nr:polyprenol monophosphomannose synthase [Candidatus Cloacimonadota bacterium]MDD2650227.1 polyprenol monophosphomannose synthase [Candidatus Cloacimonadota bacterium]MDD3501621.1 polyprenol monophosphomannose synthase [Candidatus Cloacimonadota bacterium]MDX9977998.1 polyprenol monophosphomannose synthase [Candidatus Cloacimonadales bacterium]